jgi:L-lactate dehydrogenase complex protein LldF
MHLTPIKMKKYIREALKDTQMRAAVKKAAETAVQSRQICVDQIPYWEDLRRKIHSIKKDVMEHLDRYLVLFESRCWENGIQIHWAEDGEDARGIILNLAKENGVRKIVKSKSLTTEEIHLNPCLIENGIETLETDLGEYIVQLKGEIPSHLTMPALHLSRQDIGRLFQEKLGIEYTDVPAELLTAARKRLREHFLTADMGISGVNFGIAEAGCFCIIENEANAHLTISLPEIHVAVMGIEKLLPDLDALPYFLKVLGPSATGQKASTYVNFIGGPSRNQYGEGPREVHIVLLDNGRSKILKDPKLRETLFCIRCGACLNICPVYQQIGGHAYGWVYMGPIGSTLIPQYLGETEGRYAPFLSSLCCACYDNCPIQINIPDHLLNLRNRIVELKKSHWIERSGMSVWAFLAKHPRLYRFATWFPGKFQHFLPKNKAYPVPGYTKERALARFDSKGFRKRYYASIKNQQ